MTEPRGVRRQLTLFVPLASASLIEAVRQRVDPVQLGLIAAHVTLCREDEIIDLAVPDMQRRLARSGIAQLTLGFGPPVRFAGHGILLPCIQGGAAFHQLRMTVLDREDIRAHDAHLTLAHPRNPRTHETVDAASALLPAHLEITFTEMALIEQSGAQPWVVRETLTLAGSCPMPPRG